MNFPFNIYLLALVSAAATTAATMPWWLRWCRRSGLVDDPGHRKIHDRPIPLAGGLAVLGGVLIPVLLGVVVMQMGWLGGGGKGIILHLQGVELSGWLSLGLGNRAGQLGVVLLGAVAMVLLGFLDDRFELPPATKFCGQLVIAAAVAGAGVRITLFVESTVFSHVVTVFWLLTIINAFNFMDNMNGACAGLGAIAAWCFAWGGAVQGQYLVTVIAFLVCGALAGFLPFNFPRASSFLGDAGSHLVGYLLGILAILPNYYSSETPHRWAVLKPLLILALPLIDLTWVVVLRWRAGRPFYVGDTNHLSHQLVRRGWSKPGAVLLLWLGAALAGAVSFL